MFVPALILNKLVFESRLTCPLSLDAACVYTLLVFCGVFRASNLAPTNLALEISGSISKLHLSAISALADVVLPVFSSTAGFV